MPSARSTNRKLKQQIKQLILIRKLTRQEKEIESLCLKLLLQQQPVARDLRLISSALKMITDMERIGDQAADIAEITIQLAKSKKVKIPKYIRAMAQTTIQMVNDSIDAFVKKDLNLAYSVIKCDDTVDNLFDMVKDSLIKHLVDNVNDGEQAIDLIMIAKYLSVLATTRQILPNGLSFPLQEPTKITDFDWEGRT